MDVIDVFGVIYVQAMGAPPCPFRVPQPRLAPAALRVGRDVARRPSPETGHEGPAPGGTHGGRAVDGLIDRRKPGAPLKIFRFWKI